MVVSTQTRCLLLHGTSRKCTHTRHDNAVVCFCDSVRLYVTDLPILTIVYKCCKLLLSFISYCIVNLCDENCIFLTIIAGLNLLYFFYVILLLYFCKLYGKIIDKILHKCNKYGRGGIMYYSVFKRSSYVFTLEDID